MKIYQSLRCGKEFCPAGGGPGGDYYAVSCQVPIGADEAGRAQVEDPSICVMDLDRPFLFVIRDGEAILFVGVVEQV